MAVGISNDQRLRYLLATRRSMRSSAISHGAPPRCTLTVDVESRLGTGTSNVTESYGSLGSIATRLMIIRVLQADLHFRWRSRRPWINRLPYTQILHHTNLRSAVRDLTPSLSTRFPPLFQTVASFALRFPSLNPA